ncbi:PTS fructose transporter subunit IIABC [Geomicrobium sediminis]|uniref:PTS system fructose-specific IIC component n=2 Tax=Geomicrobium TaxID=767528 RepID=A0ABS2PJL4_9BACL|nr:PTS fructose transporter subunit IIABC [Geomicrobium sediminis]MBM7635166.1 PTS system fructose-specific IIC component [Geomicrobium sediminis]
MRITELLKQTTIVLDVNSQSKQEVIEELIQTLNDAGAIEDTDLFKEAILQREREGSTGIGEGVAIPHAKSKAVTTPAIAFGRSSAGIDYDSLDGQPAHLFFMIAASEGAHSDHLQTLSRLASLLMGAEFRDSLLHASSEEEILSIIDAQDHNESNHDEKVTEDAPQIVAVTGCPTGIAHTYMAADGLKDEAKRQGITIKVETNGSDGVRNALTAEDIELASAVIIAADTKIEKDRFHGKCLIEAPVAAGIRKPNELLTKALHQDAPVYYRSDHRNDQAESGGSANKKTGFGFYRHLMNGVSNMLPFVVGGGILIALSFLFGINAADPNDPSYHPIAEALSSIGGDHAFGLMVAVLAGFIAMSIADRPGFAPGMIGGFMATTGDAGFLGGLIAGFLAGYVILGLRKLFQKLPSTFDGIKTILLYPLFGILIVGMIMHFVLIDPLNAFNSVLENWLNNMQTGNIVILGIILGGMMAVDMGGPVNKAAFTFGIAMIDAGQFGPHAAIMAGGMVPPLGIALATTLFKGKFTQEQRDAGKTNYILGSFFVTEGAIPFAAADPGRVIPSIIVGSSIAGGLSMLFNVTLMAGHGGVLTMLTPAVTNTLLYAVAIIIGAVVSGLMIGFWKKTTPAAHV